MMSMEDEVGGYSRLEIAMRDAPMIMHIFQCRQNLSNDMTNGSLRHLQGRLNKVMKCSAFHEFHDNITSDIMIFRLLKRIMKLYDIRLLSETSQRIIHDQVSS